ncbi:cyclin-dependent kinase 4 inhibitor C isoform X4 [Columba livia]|uniref:Cyclin-dependent kinase inhibitor 2C (p18, inhibits CDK4) n=1 Tax=Columba livia TaxID=8932 RepID=A0A2I0LYT8_COLLI|nr:cyclin-dependent kinase 4 inhibitor C [Columba livia]PKK22588.1 cyclin-dependent kinase inhibitor 2C (p18, inhibits CDK4) [Columba livia]
MAEPSGNELATAAAKGDLVQLTNLLQKNVNVNAQNGFGRTALQVMKLGNPEIARRLLAHGANPDLRDSTGFAVMHDVAREGFPDTLQALLEFQADVNVQDSEGNLPLHLAAREGHARVVELLLARAECRVGHQNVRGATAYDLAKLYKRHAVVQLLERGRRSPAGAD